MISLKILNDYIAQDVLKEGDYIYKMNLKDAYFSVSPNTLSTKFLWFLWSGKFCKFLCLCFGLESTARIIILAS